MKPILDLIRLSWLRFKSRTVCPLAPACLVMEIALSLADLERKAWR